MAAPASASLAVRRDIVVVHASPLPPASASAAGAPASIVVAIDFGTSRLRRLSSGHATDDRLTRSPVCSSGYGFASTRRPEEVICEQKWLGQSSPAMKTHTATLLNPDLTLHSFGEQALKNYLDLDVKARKEFYYFSHFKMALYGDLSCRPCIMAANGKSVPALTVFAASLASIKDHALTRLKECTKGVVGEADVLWVLTVPAIWSPGAKQLMREAGKASLSSVEDCVLLALESEAASLCCYAREKVIDCSGWNPVESSPAATVALHQWVVLDCGGGTVDTTVHRRREDDFLLEVCASSGGDWGSIKIDDEFVHLLQLVFGTAVIDGFKNKCALDFVELLSDFEGLKHSVTPSDVRFRRLRIPIAFLTYLQQTTGRSIEYFLTRYCASVCNGGVATEPEAISKPARSGSEDDDEWFALEPFVNNDFKGAVEAKNTESSAAAAAAASTMPVGLAAGPEAPLQYARGQLKISHEIAMNLFTPTINKITAHVRDVLGRVGTCSHIFLAGGFAESEVLRQAVETEVRKLPSSASTVILRPPHAALAVLTGAVMFGLNKRIVSSRIVKKTYGIYVAEKWRESKHGKAKRLKEHFLQDGIPKAFTLGVFHKFVEEGQEVKLDEKVTYVFNPIEDRQKAIGIRVYESPLRMVNYVDDLLCEECAALRVDLPAPDADTSGLRREIEVTFRFGETEIAVTAADKASGKGCEVRLSFLDRSLSLASTHPTVVHGTTTPPPPAAAAAAAALP